MKKRIILWQWLFGHHQPSSLPTFDPVIATKILSDTSPMILLAIRKRGLWLRRKYGAKGRAMMAVMELGAAE